VFEERCQFCRHDVTIQEWPERLGWLEVRCEVCGLYRTERQFWMAAKLKKARQPVLFQRLGRWLAEHRERAEPPEIPFEGWETLVTSGNGA
jgi:hypothetical protein